MHSSIEKKETPVKGSEYRTRLAKSKSSDGAIVTTTIVDHTKAVLKKAMSFAERVTLMENFEEFREHLALAVILHDIGKFSFEFQKLVNGKRFDLEDDFREKGYAKSHDIDYHNVISWAFAVGAIGSGDKMPDVSSSVLYHHFAFAGSGKHAAKVLDKVRKEHPECYDEMVEFYNDMREYASSEYGLALVRTRGFGTVRTEYEVCDSDGFHDRLISDEKIFVTLSADEMFATVSRSDAETMEAKNSAGDLLNLIRAILIWSDRTVSSGTDITFDEDVRSSLREEALDLSGYDAARLATQKGIVDAVTSSEARISVIPASAGFGKTLVGILWAARRREKVVWVLPTNALVFSTYRNVCSELRAMGQEGMVSVCSFVGGYVDSCTSGDPDNCRIDDCDIVVTNIDNFLSVYNKNSKSSLLARAFFGSVIFDEYHDICRPEPMFPAFVSTMKSVIHGGSGRCLLMSATSANIGAIRRLLMCGDDSVNVIGGIPIHTGDVMVHIKCHDCVDGVPLEAIGSDSFVFLNTVKEAQGLYSELKAASVPSMLVHSRYKYSDKAARYNAVYAMYGKDSRGTERIPIVNTNIIGVGWDVSAGTVCDFCLTPDDTIQRCCGRSGRFGDASDVEYHVFYDSSEEYMRRIMARCDPGLQYRSKIERSHSVKIYQKWIGILKKLDGSVVPKKYLYGLYNAFYAENEGLINSYYSAMYDYGCEDLEKIYYTVGRPSKKDSAKDKIPTNPNYRGCNRSFYVTVRTEKGYIMPLAVPGYVLHDEFDSDADESARYAFMFVDKTPFKFPSVGEVKHRLGSKWKNSKRRVPTSIAMVFANSPDSPVLLLNHDYDSELGLHVINEVCDDE